MCMIVVNGGKPLSGEVGISGAKNACLPIIAATLLNEQPVTLHNVPRLDDVKFMGELISILGASSDGASTSNTVAINAADVNITEPPYEVVKKMRASFLVLGPLLARFGRASVPLPGGCAIGQRPVGEHLAALRALGAEVRQEAGRIIAQADRLVGTDIYLNVSSVGATENALMAAALAEGQTTIHNAAEEPEVVDLCRFLTRCGVKIEDTGTKSITIHGQSRISAAVEYSVIPDRIEAGTYLLAIIATGGSGRIAHVVPEHLEALLFKLRECGVQIETGDDWINVDSPAVLKPATVRTEVFPGFPTDLQPQMTAVLTQADGVSTVIETIFESRMNTVPELRRMGAKMRVSDGTVVIEGRPGCLTGVPVEAHDLRGAATMVIAGLAAQGQTRIEGLQHLLRGFESMPEKFAALGGDVTFEHGKHAKTAEE